MKKTHFYFCVSAIVISLCMSIFAETSVPVTCKGDPDAGKDNKICVKHCNGGGGCNPVDNCWGQCDPADPLAHNYCSDTVVLN